jgi:PGF-CTERM protein
MDTDGDNVYEFDGSSGVDEPYTNQTGQPVHDRATIEVVVDTPVPSDSATRTRSPTADPSPTTAQTPTSSPPPATTSPFTPSTNPPSSSTTETDGPGFGVGGALGGLGLICLLFRRQLQTRNE